MATRRESRRSFFTKLMSAAAGAWVVSVAAGCSPAPTTKYGGPLQSPPPPPPEPAPTAAEPTPAPTAEPSPIEPSPVGPGPSVKYGGPTRR